MRQAVEQPGAVVHVRARLTEEQPLREVAAGQLDLAVFDCLGVARERIEALAVVGAGVTRGFPRISPLGQTLGYALTDSPSGQAAWILEKFWAWTDCNGHPENIFTRDELLTLVSYVAPFTPDAQNRISLPQRLRDRTKLGRDVTLVGSIRYFAVFSNEEWARREAAVEAKAETGVPAESSPPADTDRSVPTFDITRVERTGDAVIAGRAAPGATVELLRDGKRLAVNVTLGLPFIRTSPDHGVAYDAALAGTAKPESLIAALNLADQMARDRATAQ